jgi:heptosyltransferase-3
MRMSFGQFSKAIYWGVRRNPGAMGHRFALVVPCLVSAATLWTLKIVHFRRPLVLISLVESMGDIVAAEPLSRAVRQRHPNALIVWVARKPFMEVIEGFEAVDRTLPVTCLTEWMFLLTVRPPGTVYDLHISDRVCDRCRTPLRKQGQASGITLQTYYDYGSLLTVACLCAGIPPLNEPPRILPGQNHVRQADALGLEARFVVIHCASSDSSRDWPASHWDALTNYISGTLGWPIVEVGLLPVTAGAKEGRYRNLCGAIPILTMAEVIRRASLFIGVDAALRTSQMRPGHRGSCCSARSFAGRNTCPTAGRTPMP